MNKKFAIAVHGGAGTISRKLMTPELEKKYKNGLSEAVDSGFSILETGGSALLAVEPAVRSLENDIHFNAGRGSQFTHEGKNEMDASIMNGKTSMSDARTVVRDA